LTEMPSVILNRSVATKDQINMGDIISLFIFSRHYFPETDMCGLVFLLVAVRLFGMYLLT
jgi:hypothetical protein